MDGPAKERPPEGLFLAAQHQLRQPLNALGLLIGELRQAGAERDVATIAEDMRYALQLSTDWLNALCELEQAERGLLDPRPEDIPLQPVFARLKRDFAPRFQDCGLDFRVVPTSAAVHADPEILGRLLAVLLENAAKFTCRGRVLLGYRRAGEGRRIEVWDSGPGVDESACERLFEPFFRLENEVRPRERGLGLGLAFARALAALTGDRLTVSSRPGAGSCFALTLRPAGGLRPGGAMGGDSALAQLTNPLEGAEVAVLEGRAAAEVRDLLASWGARPLVVARGALAGTGARLVIADADDFAAAVDGGSRAPVNAAVVLIADVPPQAAGPEAPHFLRRPVRPARLRALCHYALAPPARE